jgi:hypothetical protein
MDEILKFLDQYGLTMEDCNEDWVEKVKNFQAIESTLTDEEKASKSQHLIKIFEDYHEIQEPEPEPIEVDETFINFDVNKENAKKKHEARKKRGGLFNFNLIDDQNEPKK